MKAQADRRKNSQYIRWGAQDTLFYQAALASAGTTALVTKYATLPIEFLEYNATTISGVVGLGNSTPDQNMVLAKYNGNLTINAGATLTTTTRKKGLVLYVAGDLVVNGTITMSKQGAYNATGDRIYTVTTSKGTVVDLGATGGAGGVIAYMTANNSTTGLNGNAGVSGVSLQSAGGGGGGGAMVYDWNLSGGNAAATGSKGAIANVYSGGVAGAGACCFNGTTTYQTAFAGDCVVGGQGGAGSVYDSGGGTAIASAGGGAGIPGGVFAGSSLTGVAGSDGTGGLLIIFVMGKLTIPVTGNINCNGSAGGGGYAGGGASGAGVLCAFAKDYSRLGTFQAIGGIGGTGVTLNTKTAKGGNGGAGYNILTYL